MIPGRRTATWPGPRPWPAAWRPVSGSWGRGMPPSMRWWPPWRCWRPTAASTPAGARSGRRRARWRWTPRVADGAGRGVGGGGRPPGVRHPVAAARAVHDDGRHVLLTGEGAADFARAAGLDFAPDEWFVDTDVTPGAPDGAPFPGTVGAVALDSHGHLAAATSTGGRQGQLPGPGGGLARPRRRPLGRRRHLRGVGHRRRRGFPAGGLRPRGGRPSPSGGPAARGGLPAGSRPGAGGGWHRRVHRRSTVTATWPCPSPPPAMARGYADGSGALRIGLGPGPIVAVPHSEG